jgi:hypothetical protein
MDEQRVIMNQNQMLVFVIISFLVVVLIYSSYSRFDIFAKAAKFTALSPENLAPPKDGGHLGQPPTLPKSKLIS